MPTPTTRLRARLIASGEELNTWGSNLNDQVFSLLDEAIAGVEKITLTGNLTLSSANYATDQARNAALIFQGSPASAVTVTIPSVEKTYTVINQTGQIVTLKAGGVGAAVPVGDKAVVVCDGTDCHLATVTAAQVNGLIANAALSGDLPGQTGNSGRFLSTDGAVPLWADVIIPDVAGGADATITTSATLTASAAVVQSVDMASFAQSVKLPDARLLGKGGRRYVVLNVGNRTFGIRDNANALLTVLPAGASAELHLRDNSTAAGSWGVTGRGLEPALTLVDHTAPTTVTGAVETAVRLTDTLSLHFGTTATGFTALAADSTPGAAATGTWTAVEGAGTATVAHAFRMSDTTAIVFWTQGTNHKAAVLTVDPATKAITVGTAASTTTAFLAQVTFSGRPVLAQLTASLYVALYGNGANAIAISVSGSTVTLGTGVASGATTAQQGLACYRISDTTALAIYLDDSGTAGTPYSIRAAVLSVTGTTIGVGTSAGINDVVLNSALPTCQLAATKYIVGYHNSANTAGFAAAITVSGTGVSFGAPLSLGPFGGSPYDYTSWNANRFQPNLFPIDGSRALLTDTLSSSGAPTGHVVLTESGGALTAGSILYSLWGAMSGGNFPQTPQGFLGFSSHADEMAVFGVTINGTALEVTGTFADGGVVLSAASIYRFGLSGGVVGILHNNATGGSGFIRSTVVHLFRFKPNAPPQYLGPLRRNNFAVNGPTLPVEVAPNKVAMINSAGLTQPAATGDNVRLQIFEFASL